MTRHSVDMPREPRDRTVAVDAEGHAWQRCADLWFCVDRYEPQPMQLIGSVQARRTWPHLVVDFGPISELGHIPQRAPDDVDVRPTVGRPVRDNPQA